MEKADNRKEGWRKGRGRREGKRREVKGIEGRGREGRGGSEKCGRGQGRKAMKENPPTTKSAHSPTVRRWNVDVTQSGIEVEDTREDTTLLFCLHNGSFTLSCASAYRDTAQRVEQVF